MSPLQFSVLLVALAVGFAVLAVLIVRLARSLVERSPTGRSIPTETEVTGVLVVAI